LSGVSESGSFIGSGTVTWSSSVSDATSGLNTTTCEVSSAGSSFSAGTFLSGTCSGSLAVSNGTPYTFEVRITDNAGNEATSASVTRTGDTIAPTTTSDVNANWQTFDANIVLTCVDAGAGCSITRYRLDTNASAIVSLGAWTTYDAATGIVVSSDGNFAIDFNSTDTVSNIEATNRAHVLVDKTAPSTSDDAPSTWQRNDFNVTLSCSDATSGCSAVRYRVDLGSWTSVTGNAAVISITSDGNHQIDYNSVDVAGNIETTKTTYALHDASSPITTTTTHGGWYDANLTVTLSCVDSASGCATTYYRLDGNSWITGTTVDINKDSNHFIEFYSVDTANNAEATQSTYVALAKLVNTSLSVGVSPRLGIKDENLLVWAKYLNADGTDLDSILDGNTSIVVDVNFPDGNKIVSASMTWSDANQRSQYVFDANVSGTYSFKVTATRKTDNKSSADKNFSVVTAGDVNITISQFKAQYLSKETIDVNGFVVLRIELGGDKVTDANVALRFIDPDGNIAATK
jgi:hypothetical protein